MLLEGEIAPYFLRFGSVEYLHNEDGNRNDLCGQCGCAIDRDRKYNEDSGKIEEEE